MRTHSTTSNTRTFSSTRTLALLCAGTAVAITGIDTAAAAESVTEAQQQWARLTGKRQGPPSAPIPFSRKSVETPASPILFSTVSSTPNGWLYTPAAGEFYPGIPQTQPFLFEGALEMAAGTNAWVEIDVLSNPTLDPSNEGNWTYNVASITPSFIGSNIYYFTFMPTVFNATRWPTSGIARVRAVWIKPDGNWGVLTSLDTSFAGLQTAHSIVTDPDPDPTELVTKPNFLDGLDGKRGFVHFANDAQSQADTDNYYSKVGTNYDGTGPSITAALGTLQAFRNRYFTPGLTEYVAEYYNEGDLGIGREMHCVWGLEIACYVSNYAPSNGNGGTLFGDEANSKSIMLNPNRVPFATVAMVERSAMALHAENKVFFVVFGANGDRVNKAQLDNKGYNVNIPGNCMVCHGSGGTRNPVTSGVSDAYFLPFDQDAFRYLSSDPANPRSRQGLHNTFRAMNQRIYFENDTGLLAASGIIKHWYQNDFVSGTFDGQAIPPLSSWNLNGSSPQRLYTQVVAKACRTCHISHVGSLSFWDLAEWNTNKALINGVLCGNKRMPNAERTLSIGWRGGVRGHFLGHTTGIFGGCRPL